MDKTRMKIAIWAGWVTVVSVAACSSGLAHAEGAGLHGLDPDRTGRIAIVSSRAPGNGNSARLIAAEPRSARDAGRHRRARPARPGDRRKAAHRRDCRAVRAASRSAGSTSLAASKLRAGEVEADRLTLRWTIEPTGKVTAPEVVGTTAVDADVLHCVKQPDDRLDIFASFGRAAARRARVPVSISPARVASAAR